jgi:hypothetical protein
MSLAISLARDLTYAEDLAQMALMLGPKRLDRF